MKRIGSPNITITFFGKKARSTTKDETTDSASRATRWRTPCLDLGTQPYRNARDRNSYSDRYWLPSERLCLLRQNRIEPVALGPFRPNLPFVVLLGIGNPSDHDGQIIHSQRCPDQVHEPLEVLLIGFSDLRV